MTDTTNRAKTYDEMDEAVEIVKDDILLFLDTSENKTVQAPVSMLIQTITSGPYANDSLAAAANVAVGELYYNSNGAVFIRLT